MASCVPAIWSWVTIDVGRPLAASSSAMPTPIGPPIGSNTTARPAGSRCKRCGVHQADQVGGIQHARARGGAVVTRAGN